MTTETGPEAGLNAALAATLNGERVASGMTFDQLAVATGIPKRTLLRKVSTVERHLSIEDVRRIAAAFNLTVVEVVTRAEERMERTSSATVSSLPTPSARAGRIAQPKTKAARKDRDPNS